jgi:transketolase
MRAGFTKGLLEAARLDSRVQVLTGDHGYALFDDFRDEFPDRFHNIGVAEANMVGIAAGMARNGLRPLIYGLAAFVPNRVFEFIKLQIAIDRLPVVIVGDGAGLVYSYLGKSHQTLEDLALMGTLEQIQSISPGSDLEMQKALSWAFKGSGPVYIRMGKSGGVYEGASQATYPAPNKVLGHSSNSKVAIIAHGSMVSKALEALAEGRDNAAIDVWSCPTIFPVPHGFIENMKLKYSKLYVLEEHLERGGLASELMLRLRGSSVSVHPICALPIENTAVGSYQWALDQHRLSIDVIADLGAVQK